MGMAPARLGRADRRFGRAKLQRYSEDHGDGCADRRDGDVQ